jgi:hypothetical protein
MWKSHFIVDGKGIDFHRGCENCCGKLHQFVDITIVIKDFHISTGYIFLTAVEMWKTQS